MLDCMDIILNSYHCCLAPNKKTEIKSALGEPTFEAIIKPIVKK